MSSEPSAAPSGLAPEPNHTVRFATLWVLVTLIALPLVIWVIGPLIATGKRQRPVERDGHRHHGAGRDGDAGAAARAAVPPLLDRLLPPAQGSALEGPAIRGDARVQTTWIVVTSLIVLGVAVFGTVRLEAGDGAGSGSGPSPLTVPKGPKLPVQVIAQQWLFTYRYPTYGGVETTATGPAGRTRRSNST